MYFDTDRASKPRVLAGPIGCLFFLIGFPAGIVLAAKLLNASVGNGRIVGTYDLTVLAVTVSGSLAAIVAGAVGYFLGTALSGWLFHDDDASKSRLDEVQAELAWVTQVLEQPEASTDAEVSVKLAAYRVKLEQQLEVLQAEQSDETSRHRRATGGNVVSGVLRVSEDKRETMRTGEPFCDRAIVVRVGD